MTTIESERTTLHQRLVDVLGPQEAKTLMQHLPTSAWDNLATKDDLEGFATKDDLTNALKGFATKDDLKGFATKDDLKGFATKDDLTNALKGFATKDDLATAQTLAGAQLTALEGRLSIGIGELSMKMGEFSLSLVKGLKITAFTVLGFCVALYVPLLMLLAG